MAGQCSVAGCGREVTEVSVGRGAGEKQARAGEQGGEGLQLQSVVAKRTRGRLVDKDFAFFLRHIPVAGTAPAVKIPETVQLSHTG